MPQISGIVKVYVNGTLQQSKEGATLDLGGYEREMVTGHSVYGFKEKLMPSTVEFTIAHRGDTKLADLKDVVDSTVRFELDSGKTYLITNACVTKTLSLKGTDGEVEVEMMGDPAEEE
jgi:hypothetical protein